MCAQETSSTDDEIKNINCNENVSEVDSDQSISGSQKERKSTCGKGKEKRGLTDHDRDTNHSNSQYTDDSNSDNISEDEMKLPGNL